MTNTNINRTGYKETKIGWIPQEWEVVKFGNVFEFLRSTSFSRANLTFEKDDHSIYNLHYGDIHSTFKREILDFDIEEKVARLIDNQGTNNFDYVIDGDLIIADVSEDYEGVGKCVEVKNIHNRKVIGGLHTFVARDNSGKTIDGFRCYIFKNQFISLALKKIATGISVYGISKNNLKKFLIPLPPLAEQKKIAEILSAWDKAINHYQLLIKNYQLRKKGLMQRLLTGKLRFREFEGQEWKEVKLGEVLNERTERNGSHLELLAITSSRGVVRRDTIERTDTSTKDKSNYKIIRPNDIGYNTMRMWQGVSGVSKYEGIISPAYTILTPTKGIDSIFIGYLFKLNPVIFLFYRYSQGLVSDTWNLKFPSLKKIKVIIPVNIEEQGKIASVLSAQDAQIELLKQQKQAIERQKKGLMQKLLTGEVRVKVS